jgi:ABC-type transporter lipoprotein component MlaA
LVRRSEDFGQTLGRWGVGSGRLVMAADRVFTCDTAGLLVDR